MERENVEDLCLGPRGYAKSTVRVVIYTIASLIDDPNDSILITSDTGFQCIKFMSVIKSTLENNTELLTLFPHLAAADKWTEKEITIQGMTEYSRMEASVTALSYGGGLTGLHFKKIIVDDVVDLENSRTHLQREKLMEWIGTTLRPMLRKGGEIHWNGCLPEGTKILKGDGTWESIEKIKMYEKVYSFDNNKLVLKKVEAVIPQGEDEVFQIRTERSIIEANKRHPFLVIVPTKELKYKSRKYNYITNYNLKWKPLSELQKGDMLVTLKKLKKGVDIIHNKIIWLFGFMIGDGWIVKNIRNNGKSKKEYKSWKICFAKGIDKELNNKVLHIFKEKFNLRFKLTKMGYYIATSKKTGEYLYELGLKKRAKNKDIPEWVFKTSIKKRKYFIEGLLEADGWIKKKSINSRGIESSSKKLINDLKLLCRTSGYLTSNIHYRERIIKAPNSPQEIRAKSWYMNINYNHRISEYRLIEKAKEKFPFRTFRFETVKEIKSMGIKKIWDLTIEDTHNFIAEGFVTHNTRYHPKDLYGKQLEAGFKTNDDSHKAILDYESKKTLWPEMKTFEELMDIKSKPEVGSMRFDAQYQNDTQLMAAGKIFRREYFQYFQFTPTGDYVTSTGKRFNKKDLQMFQTADLATSQSTTADYFAILTFGIDREGNFYIFDVYRARLSYAQQESFLINNFLRWGALRIGIEATQYQVMLQQQVDKRTNIFARALYPHTDKVTRSIPMQTKYENYKVFHFKGIPILSDFEDELTTFNEGDHDDMVDCVTCMPDITVSKKAKIYVNA